MRLEGLSGVLVAMVVTFERSENGKGSLVQSLGSEDNFNFDGRISGGITVLLNEQSNWSKAGGTARASGLKDTWNHNLARPPKAVSTWWQCFDNPLSISTLVGPVVHRWNKHADERRGGGCQPVVGEA